MAEAPSNAAVGYPTREIRITGERVAQMVHTVIQVSRFEKKLIELTMNGRRETRSLVRSASERFNRALTALENELKEAERELAIAQRPADRNSKPAGKANQGQNGKTTRTPAAPATPKQETQPTAPVKPAKPAAPAQAAPQASQQSESQAAPQLPTTERAQQPGGRAGKQKAQGGQGQNAGGNNGQAPKAKEPKPNTNQSANGDQGKDQSQNDRAPTPQVAQAASEKVVQHDTAPVL